MPFNEVVFMRSCLPFQCSGRPDYGSVCRDGQASPHTLKLDTTDAESLTNIGVYAILNIKRISDSSRFVSRERGTSHKRQLSGEDFPMAAVLTSREARRAPEPSVQQFERATGSFSCGEVER